MSGSFTYYKVGNSLFGSPLQQDLYMFTCWNPETSSCGCFSVYEDRLAANIKALEDGGSINRTDRGENFDYARREWVKAS